MLVNFNEIERYILRVEFYKYNFFHHQFLYLLSKKSFPLFSMTLFRKHCIVHEEFCLGFPPGKTEKKTSLERRLPGARP